MNPCSESKDVRIQAAAPQHAAKLLKWIKAYYLFDRIPFERKVIKSGLLLLLERRTLGRAWLIFHRGKAVGYVILTFGFDLEFGGRQATLTDLYIEASQRRKGIGRMALAQIEEFCGSHGVKAIELQVTRRNTRVLKFYRGLGFETHERIPMSKPYWRCP